MLRFRGEIEFTGTATEYLASLSCEEQEKLKSKYKDARQQAKAGDGVVCRFALRHVNQFTPQAGNAVQRYLRGIEICWRFRHVKLC
jgi:hypothetical protein